MTIAKLGGAGSNSFAMPDSPEALRRRPSSFTSMEA
jgi:hypothetical protein